MNIIDVDDSSSLSWLNDQSSSCSPYRLELIHFKVCLFLFCNLWQCNFPIRCYQILEVNALLTCGNSVGVTRYVTVQCTSFWNARIELRSNAENFDLFAVVQGRLLSFAPSERLTHAEIRDESFILHSFSVPYFRYRKTN